MKNTRITILLLTIIACSGLALAGEADNHPDAYVPFALTISGGVSLGSYEAGLNWALIHYLKLKRVKYKSKGKIYPQLKAITGASAGSINALVSAINWCVDKTKVEQLRNKEDQKDKIHNDTINDNLFRDVWLGVGIRNLLPKSYETDNCKDDVRSKSYETGYCKDDALLSRMALKQVIDNLTDLLSKPIYRDDCNIPIGLTVTRVEPTEISIAGVKVQNQRFMIPVTLHSVKPGSGRVQLQRLLVNNAVFNNVMYLPHKPDVINKSDAVAAKDILEAIQASSAFPVAFSRKELDYCRPNSHVKSAIDARSTRDSKCPQGYILDRAEFVDGGVFDNIPLGLLKMLAEPDRYNKDTRQLWWNSQRPYSYIFFDPSNRRAINSSTKMVDSGKTKNSMSDKRNGMLNQLSFLEGALVTGRQYELYNALRDDSWTKQAYFFWDRLKQKINSKQTKNNNTFKKIRDNIELLSEKYRGPIGENIGPVSDCRRESCAGKGKITELRNKVISQMKLLASSIGEKQLALDISSASADKLGDRRLIRPTRFAPITGAMLFNFGAFFDEPFREYDYYAGVYDAVIKLAEYTCCSKGISLTEQIHEIYNKDLGIPKDQKADTVFQILFEKEFGEQNLHEFIALSDKRTAFTPDPVMVILSKSLFDGAIKTDGLYQEPQFNTFLTELKKNDYIKYIDENNVLMRSAISADPDQGEHWAQDMVERVSERLIHLENEQPLRLPIGVAALIAQDEFHDEGKFYMSRTTAPTDSAAWWWPYSIDIDVRNGGGTLSWEPGIRLGREWNAELKISPVHHNRFTSNEIFFSQLDLFLVHKVHFGAVSSLAIGPTFTYTWKQWPDSKRSNLGASIYMGFFNDRLRLTLGQRTGGASYPDFPGDTAYIYISVTDLPGIYYWLIK